MEYIVRLKASATFLTIGVSFLFLVRLWREGELFGTQQVVFCVWFVVALIVQIFASAEGVWIGGLLAQLALALILILKDRVDNIY